MYLIFDFDGTIVDNFDSVIEKFMRLAEEFNFKKITPTDIPDLRNLNSTELINYLEIPILKIPRVIYRARKYMYEEMTTLPPVKGIKTVLMELNARGCTLGILTSNSPDNVSAWLKQHQMDSLFAFIYSDIHFFGKAKLLKKILKKYQLSSSEHFYIGDETRDIEAAKESNMLSVAVTWGFNSERILQTVQPNFIAHNPDDLLRIINFDGK